MKRAFTLLGLLACLGAGATTAVVSPGSHPSSAAGGAVVAAPVLTSVFGTTQVVAQGLSLALAAPSTAVTLLTYAVHDEVNWVMGVPMAIGGLLSISWGVRLAHALPERMLRGLYCAFLLLCAGLLAIKA